MNAKKIIPSCSHHQPILFQPCYCSRSIIRKRTAGWWLFKPIITMTINSSPNFSAESNENGVRGLQAQIATTNFRSAPCQSPRSQCTVFIMLNEIGKIENEESYRAFYTNRPRLY